MPIDLSGIRALNRLTKRLDDRVTTLPGVAKDLGSVVVKAAQKSFSAKADPYGSAWPKRAHVYKHPLMVKTGTLKKSLRTVVFGPLKFLVTSVGYGAYHHTGTSAGLPRRSFLPNDSRGLSPYREGFQAVFVKFMARTLGL